MDKIKQNIDLQEAIQRYNIEKSVVGTLAYNIDQNLQKGMSVDEAVENVLQKSKSMPIGTIHNGFKKIAEGKWRKVSSEGKTKEDHEKELERIRFNDSRGHSTMLEQSKLGDIHTKISKLDSKDYSDEEVTGGEKKEDNYDQFKNKTKKWSELSQEEKEGGLAYDKIISDLKDLKKDNFTEKEFESWWNKTRLNDNGKDYTKNKMLKNGFIKSQPESTLFKSEQTEAQKAKVKKVVEEFNKGILKSSTGELITDRSEALRFALSEAGIEIEKGVYVNDAENRKLGRVGQKYGSKKEDESDFKIINDASSVSALMTPIWGNKSKGFLYFTDGLRVDIPTINERLDKSGDRKLVSLLDVTGTNGENQQDPHTFKNDKIANSFSVRVNKKGRFELLQHKID